MITVRNKFDTLLKSSEKHTPNDEYENFVTTHIEATAKCIPFKPRIKCRVPWKSIIVRKKTFLCDNRNPTNMIVWKLMIAQEELDKLYLKEQLEYI